MVTSYGTRPELKANEYISEFVSGSPKNYAHKVYNSVKRELKTLRKARGITLNYKASQLVNYDTIKYFVLNAFQQQRYVSHG